MTLEQDLYSVLSNDATITGIVSDRIYAQMAPNNTDVPFLVYTQVTGTHPMTFSGRSTLKNSLMQVDCLCRTLSQARTLGDAVIAAVDDGLDVGSISDQTFYQLDAELHRVSIDFSLWG